VKHTILTTNMYKQRLRINYVTDRYLVQFIDLPRRITWSEVIIIYIFKKNQKNQDD